MKTSIATASDKYTDNTQTNRQTRRSYRDGRGERRLVFDPSQRLLAPQLPRMLKLVFNPMALALSRAPRHAHTCRSASALRQWRSSQTPSINTRKLILNTLVCAPPRRNVNAQLAMPCCRPHQGPYPVVDILGVAHPVDQRSKIRHRKNEERQGLVHLVTLAGVQLPVSLRTRTQSSTPLCLSIVVCNCSLRLTSSEPRPIKYSISISGTDCACHEASPRLASPATHPPSLVRSSPAGSRRGRRRSQRE